MAKDWSVKIYDETLNREVEAILAQFITTDNQSKMEKVKAKISRLFGGGNAVQT